MYSGSEVISRVLESLRPLVREKFGSDIDITLVFAAESDSDKAQWILDQVNPIYLSTDVSELNKSSPFDSRSKTNVTQPIVDFVSIGWPCVDGSKNNTKRAQHRDCVKAGTNKTGKGFQDCQAMNLRHICPSS